MPLEFYDRAAREAVERHQALLAESAELRLAGQARQQRLSMLKRGARLVGRALVVAGAGMLRYGQADTPMVLELRRPGAGSATLN